MSASGNANAVKPEGQVEAQNETSSMQISPDETVHVFLNGKAITPARPEWETVQNNMQSLKKNTCNAQFPIMSNPPVSATLPIPTPGQLNIHPASSSTNAQQSVRSALPRIVIGAAKLGSNSSVTVGGKVIQGSTSATLVNSPLATVNAAGQVSAGTGLGTASQAGVIATSVAPTSKVTRVATITPTAGKGTVIALPRANTAQQNGAPRATQNASVQLPANFQIPQGMVLIRSDSGQLMLVSQQALAQAQAQGGIPRVATIPNFAVRVSAPQVSTTEIIRKPDSTPIIKVPPPPSSTPVTSLQKMSVVKATGCAVLAPASQAVSPAVPLTQAVPLIIPPKTEGPKTTSTATISAETLENVKKCKNFLVTLIKLASSGTHSLEMAKNVKELVKSLLDGKIEPEEFTDRLYTELKSSPQPYLVPFLKKSLPAVRQLTPNSQLFIQQCTASQAAKPNSVVDSSNNKVPQSCSVITQSIKPGQPSRSTQLVIQQPRGVMRQSVMTTQPPLLVSMQSRTLPKQLVTTFQTAGKSTGTVIKQSPLQVSKLISVHTPQDGKKGFKDSTPGSFRDEDDINDVASMAGVNLTEENARILATNSEHVGAVVRSCRDDPFLLAAALHKRMAEIGERHGITDVGSDVINLVSHATQERLRELVEKLTIIAQHRKMSLKDNFRYKQTSDTRSQLKFLEQLDRMEKQRKDEEEREILLRVAKSRSNREDPEQLKLKQKAKEMQQLELAQMQQRDANLTALAAIGPRKKRLLDSLGYGSGNEIWPALGSSGPTFLKPASLQRITHVSLRDLVFCMEQDPLLRHSFCLYQALLR